jgi:hypothetical protein
MISISDITNDVLEYKHEMLHMTGLLRLNQKERIGIELPTFLSELRKNLALPPLQNLPSDQTAVSIAAASAETNVPFINYSLLDMFLTKSMQCC